MPDNPTMNIDGASRGNPGPAAFAYVIARPGLPTVEKGEVMGRTTNNVAEYTALVRGLEAAADLGIKRLDVFSDSELLVKQINGEYRVKHPDLLPLFREANEILKDFEAVSFSHVRRENNKRADALCNAALDGKKGDDPKGGGQMGQAKAASPQPSAPKKPVSDSSVREDALAILRSAAQAWADGGLRAVAPELIWEQLWSVLEENAVLRKKA